MATKSCLNQKCIDPCPGSCAHNGLCRVINHFAVCNCPPGYTGDAYSHCVPIGKLLFLNFSQHCTIKTVKKICNLALPPPPQDPIDVCNPSPCGENSMCTSSNGNPSCLCLSEYIGSPPNCRPECTTNSDCSSQTACINRHCQNPCINACGTSAECSVFLHTPNCLCPNGLTGNPFVECRVIQHREFLHIFDTN